MSDRVVTPSSALTVDRNDHVGSVGASSVRWRAVFGRLGGTEQAVLAIVGLSTVARASFTTYPTTLRIALFIVVGLPGLVALATSVRSDRPARWLTAFLAVALVSALWSENVLYALKADLTGSYSWVYLALGAGWWAIGRRLGPSARSLLPWVLLAGFAVNAVMGVVQVVLDIRTGALATFPGRASGLMDNPIYFATFGAGLTTWALVRVVDDERPAWLAVVFGLSFATGLSGSRVATAAVLLLALGVVVWSRRRSTAIAAGVTLVGVVLSSLFTAAFAQNSTAERLSSGEGPGARLEIWRYGFAGWLDRPILGWGPGHYGPATWHRYTVEFVRDTAWSDERQPWVYPHNLGVLLLVTTGALGVLLLVGFLVSGLRRGADRHLLAFVVGAAATYSLQPATIQTWPIVLIVLGAAMHGDARPDATDTEPRELQSSWTLLTSAGLAVGLLLGGYLVVADYRIGAASERGDLDALESAAAWLPRDPAVASFVALQMEIAGLAGEDRFPDAIEWSSNALAWGPESPMAHSNLAIRQYLDGDLESMRASLDRAIELQEWNPSARRLMVVHALASDDVEAARKAVDDACRLELSICDDARRELEALVP